MGEGMSKVLEGIYIGNLSDSRNIAQLKKNSISHVVSLHNKDGKRPRCRGVQYLMVDIVDCPDQPVVPAFGECLEFIHRGRASGGNVLVHCLSGVSASATIVVAYLLIRTELSINKIIKAIRVVRPYVNPNHGFCRQLEDWNRKGKKFWKKSIKMWPEVNHDDEKRCTYLLTLYKSQPEDPNKPESVISEDLKDLEITDDVDRSCKQRNSLTDSGRNSTSESEYSDTKSLAMGNTESVGSQESIDSAGKKTSRTSHMGKLKAAILHKRRDKEPKLKKDTTNNNNNGVSKDPMSNGIYYTDNITRSSTLPNNINKVNNRTERLSSYPNNTLSPTMLQARLLPAYKTPKQGIIGDIRNRQRIMSSPSYTRSRLNSQSSTHSHRYNGCNRVVTTHIPDRIDKRLVRSRSVGVIPDAELRMRRTESASVVKMEDCEDWIV